MTLNDVNNAIAPWKADCYALRRTDGEWDGEWVFTARLAGHEKIQAHSGMELINKVQEYEFLANQVNEDIQHVHVGRYHAA